MPTTSLAEALRADVRAFGLGDYRALSNAGTWMLGRLQTDADRARVIEGLGEDKQCCCFSLAGKKSELGNIVKRLAHRWFVVRDAKSEKLTLLNPRFAMSFLRGPMTGVEIRRAKAEEAAQ